MLYLQDLLMKKKSKEHCDLRWWLTFFRVDENGDIILTEKTSEVARNGKTEGAASIGIERNENALKVKMEEQSKREKAKKEHEKKVQRDKEQRFVNGTSY
jgi:hypothetical protein